MCVFNAIFRDDGARIVAKSWIANKLVIIHWLLSIRRRLKACLEQGGINIQVVGAGFAHTPSPSVVMIRGEGD